MLRLLKLPDEVQDEVAAGRLSMGHARALLALADEATQRTLARDIIARSLSVRETEALVKKAVDAAASACSGDGAEARRRPHARGGGQAEAAARHARAHRPAREADGSRSISSAKEELIRIYEALAGS